MKVLLCVAVCKFVRFAGKLIGKGSSKPGEIALKICPDIISRLLLPPTVVAVTGSNGKTSTVEMIVKILEADGRRVVWNKEGSNQTQGIATMLLSNADIKGCVKADCIVLETDERYAERTFRYIHPTHFVVLNILRDQMTRNGHPEFIFNKIKNALSDEMSLILNGDDPLTMNLDKNGNSITFGFAQNAFQAEKPVGMYDDGRYCPVCAEHLTYRYRVMGIMGNFCCPSCGYARKNPKYEITSFDMRTGTIEIQSNGTHRLRCGIDTVYHAYNMLAAYAVTSELNVSATAIEKAISAYYLKNGRVRCWDYKQQYILLLTSKHENSTSYDWSLEYVARKGGKVLIIVDAVSRKYYTSETSWLWDIDFDKLSTASVKNVYIAGKYVWDLAQRLEYTDIDSQKIKVLTQLDEISTLFTGERENLIVITCFSDRDKFIRRIPSDANERSALAQ